MGFILGAAITAGIGALIGGISSGVSSYNQMKAEQEQIDFQKQRLQEQQNYLTQQYNNSVKWTKYQFGQSMNQGNLSISQATQNRDITAITNADTMKLQNEQDEL